MIHLTFLQQTPGYAIALMIFVVVTLSHVCGHWLRQKKLQRDPDHSKIDMKTINGMLIGLLGLLLAFTFSMSNSRFDDRRHLIIEEANNIGTAVLRTDMYPDSVRKLLRATLREYVERRITFYQVGMDLERATSEFLAGQELSSKVWKIATEYARKDDVTTRTALLIPAINDMIDITTTRLAAGEGTIPDSIMYFLFVLCSVSSFLLGYDHIGKIDWIITIGYAVTLAITVFCIVDLDRPRGGLINMDKPNQKMVELRGMFNE